MELRDYLNVIRNRKWIIIQAVVIVTLVALAVSMIRPPIYVAESKVLISEKDTGAALFGTVLPEFSSQPERGLQTQVQLMQLRPLAEEALRELDLGISPGELLGRVSVEEIDQTNVVIVSARAEDPDEAAAISNAIAEKYVMWSRETKRESIRAAAEEVATRLDEARSQILEIGGRIEGDIASDELKAELQILVGTYTTLAEKLEQLRINEELEVGTGRVVSPATVPTSPVEPNPVQDAALGAAVGLMLGLAMAFLYEYLDDTIKSTDEMERVFGVPILGVVPVEKREKGAKRRLTVLDSPGSPTAEAYRVLRNSLDFINFENDIKTLLVTSAIPSEGKSTVSANLALSLAQTGKKVVLVSSDFRRPSTQEFFDTSNAIGLSDVLLGAHTLKSALMRPGDEHLLVLPSGPLPPNPADLLGSSKMKDLMIELREWADWIIVDTPPLLAVADPASVSRFVDGVLLVSKAGVTTRVVGRKAKEVLEKVGARIVGSVVWGIEEGKTDSGYGYYAGGYYYTSGYQATTVPIDTGQKSGSKRKSAHMDHSGAQQWSTQGSTVRSFATFLGRFLSGLLAFLATCAVIVIVMYFLDGYFDWGLVDTALEIWPF